MDKRNIAALVRPLSPTAARVLLVLIFGDGMSFTGKELSKMLGKSQNTISTAVGELEYYGYAQNNGRQYGWSLLPEFRQASFEQLSGAYGRLEEAAPPALHGGARANGRLPALQGEVAESSGQTEEKIQKNLEDTKKFVFSPPSSSSRSNYREEGEEERKKPEIQKNLDFAPDKAQIRQILVQAGVGPRSKKLRTLLGLSLDVAYVQAHVHVWEQEQSPVGWLITRLEDGDAVPACHCPACKQAHIPPEYKGVIKR